MTRNCYACKRKDLDLSLFNKGQYQCRLCQSKYSKKYIKLNPRTEEKKQRYEDNKKTILSDKKLYYQNNKEIISQKKKTERLVKRDILNARTKNWKNDNQQYVRTYNNTYNKTRKKIDPLYRVICSLRSRTASVIKQNNWKKDTKFAQYIGCSYDELINHLQSQFTSGMSWKNRNLWHIDHIHPLSLAKTEEELYKLCHYTNLQPLWAIENLQKGTKIV